MRLRLERDPDHGLIFRLPGRLGVSCWPPNWALLVGVRLSDGCLEWHLGPFAGEVWRDVPEGERLEPEIVEAVVVEQQQRPMLIIGYDEPEEADGG